MSNPLRGDFSWPSYRPPLETYNLNYGIGIVGYAGIVRAQHLPAYRAANYRVVSAADPDPERRELAQKDGIPHVYEDFVRLIRRADVDVIDCAVPHHTPANIAVRMAIIREAARAGKAVLMQKPLSYDLETAEQMVKIAEDGGISLAVNQNLRFDPAIYATKHLLSAERFGEPGVMTFANLSTTGPKFGFTTDGVIIGWQIHAIDSLRWFAGADAISVYSTNRNNGSLYQIEFSSGALATFTEYHNEGTFRNETPFRIWAANGAIRGNHRWNPGSRWEPDLVEVRGYDWPKEIDWVTYRLPDDPSYQEVFVKPDYEVSASIGGFIGMMGEFMQSLHEGRLAVTNARDNLMSLRTYFAGQLSAEQRRPVDPRDMTLL